MPQDTQPISQDELTKGLLGAWKGQPWIEYVLNVPPHDAYRWNGSVLVSAGATGIGGSITSITYNGSGQITNYTDSGIAYVITYNGNGTVNTVAGSGVTRTVAYNGDGTVATYQ